MQYRPLIRPPIFSRTLPLHNPLKQSPNLHRLPPEKGARAVEKWPVLLRLEGFQRPQPINSRVLLPTRQRKHRPSRVLVPNQVRCHGRQYHLYGISVR